MSERHTSLINAQPDSDIELGSMRRVTSFHFPQDTDSANNSTRSSLDESYYEKNHCDVHIHDDVSVNPGANPENHDEHSEAQACHRPFLDGTKIFSASSNARSTGTADISERLRTQHKVDYLLHSTSEVYYRTNLGKTRDPMRSRWM